MPVVPVDNFEEITYSSLVAKIAISELVEGKFYKITDFKSCYDQPNYDASGAPIITGNYKEASVSPIIVLAISSDKLHAQAYQPAFPNDNIKYDINWDTTEVTSGTALGRITERIDEFNNRTDYDHRFIEFRRYKLYYYDINTQGKTGTVQVSSVMTVSNYKTATVTGTGTAFTTEVSVNDIIAIPAMNSDVNLQFCKVTAITNDTQMTIQGYFLSTAPASSKFYATSNYSNMSYRMSNIVSDALVFSEDTLFGQLETLNAEHNNNYFGNTANLFSEYSLTFLLPNNVAVSGPFSNNTFKDGCRNNSFDDDMTNNIVENNFRNNSITNDFDGNVISNDFYDNLLIGSFQNNIIDSDFYDNLIIFPFKYNKIGKDFNNNIITATGTEGFWRNKIGNKFNSNTITGDFGDNEIGFYFSNNIIEGDFGSGYKDSVIGSGPYAGGNKIGNLFKDNTIANGFNDNTISDWFVSNVTPSNFQFNQTITKIDSINFDTENGVSELNGEFTYTTPASTLDGIYTATQLSTSGSGVDAEFKIVVTGGVVEYVSVIYSGRNYSISDTITIDATDFNGAENLVITVGRLTSTPMVVSSYNCNIMKDVNDKLVLVSPIANNFITYSGLINGGSSYYAQSITSEII